MSGSSESKGSSRPGLEVSLSLLATGRRRIGFFLLVVRDNWKRCATKVVIEDAESPIHMVAFLSGFASIIKMRNNIAEGWRGVVIADQMQMKAGLCSLKVFDFGV